MSRFFSPKYSALEAYVPGEQPRDLQYIKLNTNESPFPPSPKTLEAAAKAAARTRLYSDPECTALRAAAAKRFGVSEDMILMTNGSDEILNFAFMAFTDENTPAVFPALSYGFYPVFAAINRVPMREIPLREDFSIDPADYDGAGGMVVIANPNAPTGLALSLREIEDIVRANPENVVVIDEAYVDFGTESAVSLTKQYDNLLVSQTFSKSRSMAGARLGFGIGNAALIRDLNTVKYSTNPYNVNMITAAMGEAALLDDDYYMANCRVIAENREAAKAALCSLGFSVTDSKANFLFAKHPALGGRALYEKLKARGVLIRHFSREDIKDYNRITVGTKEEMETLISHITAILKEEGV